MFINVSYTFLRKFCPFIIFSNGNIDIGKDGLKYGGRKKWYKSGSSNSPGSRDLTNIKGLNLEQYQEANINEINIRRVIKPDKDQTSITPKLEPNQ